VKITIITVVKNNNSGIKKTIASIRLQDNQNIEHIIVDGLSNDGTVNTIFEMKDENTIIISEKDSGLYDAINKGIKIATGDIIGILHSGDVYAASNILSIVENKFSTKNIDALYADVDFVDSNGLVIRKYSSKYFSRENIKNGIIMAHTSLFLSRYLYLKYGLYNENYKIAGDFDFICRLFKNNIRYEYDNQIYIKMINGGISNKSILNRLIINKEIYQSLKANKIKINPIRLLYRYFIKLNEFKFF